MDILENTCHVSMVAFMFTILSLPSRDRAVFLHYVRLIHSVNSRIGSRPPMKLQKDHEQLNRLIRSPLRYPGAKLRLFTPIAETLKLNSLKPKLFCEPFGGGLSVSLRLLSKNLVDNIAVGERDSLVAAFWKIVFNDADWLVKQINALEVTLENWKSFRELGCKTNRERALACLFLNRTSFSGILAESAGPIGGQKQASDYR
jgi:DNA adenine methylase